MDSRASLYRGISVAATVSLMFLAGCESSSTPEVEEQTTSSSPSSLTESGSELKVGETETVSLGDDVGVVEITITSIDRGRTVDLAKTGIADASERTPYYVRYEMLPVSGQLGGVGMFDNLTATAGGKNAPALIYSGDYPECENNAFPAEPKPGVWVTSCTTFLAEKGGPPVDTVRFHRNVS